MSEVTSIFKRIMPFKSTISAIFRRLWYLRTFLLLLVVVMLLSAFLLLLFENNQTGTQFVQPVKNYCDALFLTISTACTLSFGNSGAISTVGRVLLLFDSLVGFVIIGLIVWIIQYCIGENTLVESRGMFFSTKKSAKIE